MTRIYTSLSPAEDRIEVQRYCLLSWKAQGYQPVVVNSPAETQALKCKFPMAWFRPHAGNGKPSIRDLLTDGTDDVRGIVNADIFLSGRFKDYDFDLLVAHRNEIDGQQYTTGFDAFFYRELPCPLSEIDPGFKIGEPAWDFYLPILYLRAGKRVVLWGPPTAYHVYHGQRWTPQVYDAQCGRLIKTFGLKSVTDGLEEIRRGIKEQW